MKKWWNQQIRRLYDWAMRVVASPKAIITLCLVSFMESSFFPIPPDVLLIPLVLKQREKAFRIATYCMIASVLGGAFGYAIGHFAYGTIEPFLSQGFIEKMHWFSGKYNEYGSWIVFGAGITPFPYKIITIASGVTGLNFVVFMVASLLARGLRFFLIAFLLWKWGKPMQEFIEKHLGILSILFFVLLIGSFYLIKYL